MNLQRTQIGYPLGHFPVRCGSGECRRPGCKADAVRALVMIDPPDLRENVPRCDLVILWLCWSCGEAAERVLDGQKKVTAASC